ncbi:MAG TPA: DUF4440 domain-containing protein [Gemmatimonadaceae bacterium]|nr:DUF4440 domain-containing protein [Gemmatimonadaceae bacterium]
MRTTGISLTILGAAALACAGSSAPAALADADKAAIATASADFQKAVRASAWDAWADSYSADAVLGPPNGAELRSRAGMLNWAKTIPPNKDFTLKQVDVEGRGDLAYVYGHYSWVVMPPGAPEVPDSGKYIEVWKKQSDGKWKIVRDVFNSDVPLPAPPAPAPAAAKKK